MDTSTFGYVAAPSSASLVINYDKLVQLRTLLSNLTKPYQLEILQAAHQLPNYQSATSKASTSATSATATRQNDVPSNLTLEERSYLSLLQRQAQLKHKQNYIEWEDGIEELKSIVRESVSQLSHTNNVNDTKNADEVLTTIITICVDCISTRNYATRLLALLLINVMYTRSAMFRISMNDHLVTIMERCLDVTGILQAIGSSRSVKSSPQQPKEKKSDKKFNVSQPFAKDLHECTVIVLQKWNKMFGSKLHRLGLLWNVICSKLNLKSTEEIQTEDAKGNQWKEQREEKKLAMLEVQWNRFCADWDAEKEEMNQSQNEIKEAIEIIIPSDEGDWYERHPATTYTSRETVMPSSPFDELNVGAQIDPHSLQLLTNANEVAGDDENDIGSNNDNDAQWMEADVNGTANPDKVRIDDPTTSISLYSSDIEPEKSTVFTESMWLDEREDGPSNDFNGDHQEENDFEGFPSGGKREELLRSAAVAHRSYAIEISFDPNVGEMLETEESRIMFDVLRDAMKLVQKRYLPRLHEYGEMITSIQQVIRRKILNATAHEIPPSMNKFQNLKNIQSIKEEVNNHLQEFFRLVAACRRLNVNAQQYSKSLWNKIDEDDNGQPRSQDKPHSSIDENVYSTAILERRAKATEAFHKLRTNMAKRKSNSGNIGTSRKKRK